MTSPLVRLSNTGAGRGRGRGRCLVTLALALSTAVFGCPDLGDQPMDWSELDRPAPGDAASPSDAGEAGDSDATQPDSGVPVPEHVEVLLRHIAIEPAYARVAVGGTVTWRNLDLAQHDVRSGSPEAPSPLFNSGLLDIGDSFTVRFESPGPVPYYCSTHSEQMRDAVIDVLGDVP